jgi:hypothetical protein
MMPLDEDPPALLADQALAVHLDLGPYRLVPGYQGELGQPIEAFLSLYAVLDGRAVGRIETPIDLFGIVHAVDDEAQALAFVQLFTAPETHYLFPGDETVIDVSVIPDGAPARVSTLPAALARRLGIEAPQVTGGPDGFTVHRSLARAGSLTAPRTIVRRAERVSREGRYTRLGEVQVAEVGAADLRIPYYE